MSTHKRLQYTEEDMQKALEAVKNGMAKAKASQIYGVPRTTLIGKLQGKVPIEKKIGLDTVLTKHEETLLVKWIFHVSAQGFPVTTSHLFDSVQMLMKSLKRPNPFTDGRPDKRWYKSFIKRHPELSLRVSQNLTSSRANVTEQKIRNWFKEIEEYLVKTGNLQITQDPTRIYNCDETAFFLSPKEDKVLVKKGEKAVYTFISNDEKECLTTLFMFSASGALPPPMVVYSYKRLPKHIVDKIPNEWGIFIILLL